MNGSPRRPGGPHLGNGFFPKRNGPKLRLFPVRNQMGPQKPVGTRRRLAWKKGPQKDLTVVETGRAGSLGPVCVTRFGRRGGTGVFKLGPNSSEAGKASAKAFFGDPRRLAPPGGFSVRPCWGLQQLLGPDQGRTVEGKKTALGRGGPCSAEEDIQIDRERIPERRADGRSTEPQRDPSVRVQTPVASRGPNEGHHRNKPATNVHPWSICGRSRSGSITAGSRHQRTEQAQPFDVGNGESWFAHRVSTAMEPGAAIPRPFIRIAGPLMGKSRFSDCPGADGAPQDLSWPHPWAGLSPTCFMNQPVPGQPESVVLCRKHGSRGPIEQHADLGPSGHA